jgi:hypothetical protein
VLYPLADRCYNPRGVRYTFDRQCCAIHTDGMQSLVGFTGPLLAPLLFPM